MSSLICVQVIEKYTESYPLDSYVTWVIRWIREVLEEYANTRIQPSTQNVCSTMDDEKNKNETEDNMKGIKLISPPTEAVMELHAEFEVPPAFLNSEQSIQHEEIEAKDIPLNVVYDEDDTQSQPQLEQQQGKVKQEKGDKLGERNGEDVEDGEDSEEDEDESEDSDTTNRIPTGTHS
jgi:hypothetical protein